MGAAYALTERISKTLPERSLETKSAENKIENLTVSSEKNEA